MGIAERKEREKQQRREEIMQAAEEVFFSKGFEKSTMDDVAEKAELSKGTLYLYFKSKEDLHMAVARKAINLLRIPVLTLSVNMLAGLKPLTGQSGPGLYFIRGRNLAVL